MTDVEQIKIESDERGFELHLIVGDDIEVSPEGRVVLNIQQVAEDLYYAAQREIGPWLVEMYAAKREYDTGIADDPTQQHVLDQIKREVRWIRKGGSHERDMRGEPMDKLTVLDTIYGHEQNPKPGEVK